MGVTNREKMEAKFGELGTGQTTLVIKNVEYSIGKILVALGILYEDIVAIDAFTVEGEGGVKTFAVRYLDGQDRCIIAHEFDEDFRYLGEIRVHLAEYMGEEEYFNFPWNVGCPWTI